MESISDDFASQLSAANISVDAKTSKCLQRLEANGLLTVGWPNRNATSSLLSHSIVWIPGHEGSLDLRTTAIVSSRLGRELDRLDPLFFVLRTAVSQLNPERQRILTACGTSSHPYVRRCSQIFGVPLLQVMTATPNAELVRWATNSWTMYSKLREENDGTGTLFCFVSNQVSTDAGKQQVQSPLRDAVEVLASDQLLVLHARQGGNLNRLIDFRLTHSAANETPSHVYLSLGDDRLVPKNVAQPLMDEGAIGWFTTPKRTGSSADGLDNATPCPLDWTNSAEAQTFAPIWHRLENQDRYLIHCTRRAMGNWPDQSESEFLDELILGESSRDRSCFAALSRIVRMQRLLATSDSIRDSNAVVSFTSIELDRIAEVRTFRSHRGRWDFEPYGIAIERSWLIALGAREVIYGDDATWDAMSPDERPFFQKVSQNSGSIDWSIEREWRVPCDVDLSGIARDRAVVFVPSIGEAELLRRVSLWPVVVVDPARQS